MDWRSCACTMTSPSISWTRQLNVLAKCSVYSRTLHAPPLIRRSFVGRPALALDVNSKKQLPTIDIHHIHERMPLIWWTKTSLGLKTPRSSHSLINIDLPGDARRHLISVLTRATHMVIM